MKLKFFQPALLVVAATAAEANEESQTASYFPDMLVQTASIIDFFYPQEQEQVSVAEVLAQTAAEADVDAEAENDGLTRVNMRDNQNNMLTVEIPKDEHKII